MGNIYIDIYIPSLGKHVEHTLISSDTMTAGDVVQKLSTPSTDVKYNDTVHTRSHGPEGDATEKYHELTRPGNIGRRQDE